MSHGTKEQMIAYLKQLGVKTAFKPYEDPVDPYRDWEEKIMLHVNKPARLVNGELSGVEISWCGDVFKIWTPKKKQAHNWAKRFNLHCRDFDGAEAELHVPAALADKVLKAFGAKVKQNRKFTTEQLNAIKTRLATSRQNQR